MMAKVEYVDSLDLRTATYTRYYNDGTEIKADLTEGTDSAFAVAKIKDEVIRTEMPNLTLRLFRQMPKNKESAAKAKAKSKAKGKGKAKKKAKAESKGKAAGKAPEKVGEPPKLLKPGLYGDGDSWSSDAGDANEPQEEEQEEEEGVAEATFVRRRPDIEVPEEDETGAVALAEAVPHEEVAEEDETEAVAFAGAAAPSTGGERDYRRDWYKKTECYGIRQKFGAKRQVFSVGSGAALSQEDKKNVADSVIRHMKNGMTEETGKRWADEQIKNAVRKKRRIR